MTTSPTIARKDYILKSIKTFNQGRLSDVMHLKYTAMHQDAFRFFRATCYLFYDDFVRMNPIEVSPLAWLCGDLHLENFGSYKGDNGLVYFDVNDFDEAILAPITWDIVRLLTSIFVAARTLGVKKKVAREIVKTSLSKYAETLQQSKAISIEKDISKGVVKRFLTKVEKRKQQELMDRYLTKIHGKLRFRTDERNLLAIEREKKTALKIHFEKEFKVTDVAFRIAGTSSLGLERYALLVEDIKGKNRLLDLKLAKPSAILPFLSNKQPDFASEATRVITLQRRFQDVSPAFLRAIEFENQPFVLRELQPSIDRISLTVKILNKSKEIHRIVETISVLTASGHLRGTGRQGSAIADELTEFAERTSWQKEVFNYAEYYAQQVETDFELFREAYKEGRFKDRIDE